MHKKNGRDLEVIYNKAKRNFTGLKNLECSICGKGLRHIKNHLKIKHRLKPGTKKYRSALGTQPEKSKHVGKKERYDLKLKQREKNRASISLNRWIEHESRGDTKIDASGMKRNIKTVMSCIKNFPDLMCQTTAVEAYKMLYEMLRKKNYKYSSINVILGTLKKFIDWICSETNLNVAMKSRREHEYYTKTCRRRGKMENMQRKIVEYIPDVRELKPLIHAEKHQDIIDGILQDPKEILRRKGIDLIHATIAWPLLLNCGVRTGVIRNMLVSEVRQAKTYKEGVVIHVKDHKTADQYGPYRIFLQMQEKKLLVNYIENRNEDSRYVFCTKQGKQSSYASVARKMKALFKLYGLSRLNIGTMRKFITTQVHKNGNENSIEATACLLKHSVRTARRDYKAKQQDADALRAAISISNTLKEQMATTTDAANISASTDTEDAGEGSAVLKSFAPDKVRETHVTPFVMAHLDILYDRVTSEAAEKGKDGATATPVESCTTVEGVRELAATTMEDDATVSQMKSTTDVSN